MHHPSPTVAVCSAFAAIALAGSIVGSAHAAAPIKYPATKVVDTVDDYHGTKVADPYRWLEDDNAQDTKDWVTAQNKVTFDYLATIPERAKLEARLTKLWNYERFSAPRKEGGKYFFSRNDGLQPQSVVYIADTLDATPRVLLDPNTYRKDGTVALAGAVPNEQATYLAFGIADAGSDWNTWRIRDIATGKDLDDEIRWVKFSGASWTKDGKGFLYQRYSEPAKDKVLTAVNESPMVYYHTVGTKQDADVLVYQRPDQPKWGFGAGVTEDGAYLVMSVSEGTSPKNRFFFRPISGSMAIPKTPGNEAISKVEAQIKAAREHLEKSGKDMPEAAKRGLEDGIKAALGQRARLVGENNNAAYGFTELLNDFDASYNFISNIGPVFYFTTDLDAPRQKVIAIDTRSPARANWKVIIPQSDATLKGVDFTGGHLIADYLRDARSEVKVFKPDGTFVRNVDLPGLGTASGFGGKANDNETFYSYSSYTTAPSIYQYDVATGKSTLWKASKVDFDASKYETKQVFYTSKDGTKVPMFITARKDVSLDSNNPTLLYGYGGFNIPLTPGFSPVTAQWLDLGGIYAVANIRGGGEYGETWHTGGTKLNKQNVFDDFIAAAEYLIASKYTKPARLAIQGGSNGGLLVGAAMAQRPELFGAALPAVGVMDMLRFHKFTIGWAWTSDYGSSDDAAQFKALNAYSPYHLMLRAKAGTKYPSTMVTTGDHDDRVVPGHSFKFAAALQKAHSGDNPVLIRIDVRAGHGAGKPTAKRIQEAADVYGFLIKELGMKTDL